MADFSTWLVSVIATVYPGINPPPPYIYDAMSRPISSMRRLLPRGGS